MDAIRSTSNPLVKRARSVVRGRERGILALEGDRLVEEALRQGLEPEAVLVSEERSERADELAARGVAVHLLAPTVFASLSQLKTPAGILALVAAPAVSGGSALPDAEDALVVVPAGIQDPGNLGALARTAEAAGAAALISLPGGCSPWSPKAMRGSMGSLLRLPVLEFAHAREAWTVLSARGYRNVCARTRGATAFEDFDWSGRVALWAFAETGAAPPELAELVPAAEGVSISMAGDVESLNVTAAAAVLLFAAGRARQPTQARTP